MPGRPVELPSPWRELAAAYEGVAFLAGRCGVTSRTIQRWARGDFIPRALIRRHVDMLAKRRGIAPPFGGE